MRLSRFVAPIDKPALLLQIRGPVRLLGLAFAAPLAVALIYREWTQALVFLGLGVTAWLIGRPPSRGLAAAAAPRDALVLGAAVYLVFSVLGAVAFLPVAPFIDGLFESMSGFTTTGLGVLDVERLPRSLVFFRSFTQWIGGAGIVVLSILVLPGPRATLAHFFAAEFKHENLLGNLVTTMRVVFATYGLLTAAAALTYFVVGMSAFDAVVHALSTLSTGGFSSHPRSVGGYPSVAVTAAISLFMLAGAIAFPLYYGARRDGARRFVGDPQFLTLLAFVGIAFGSSLLYARWSLPAADSMDYLFHSISAVTTTGFNTTDAGAWPEGFRLVIVLLMVVGGSAGSTAGGVKLVRLLLVAKLIGWYLSRALLPSEAQVPIREGDHVVRDEEIRETLGFLGLYAAVLAGSTLLIAAAGFDPMDCLFEATSALGTVGLSTGITAASLPVWTKLVLIVDMWAGRLEILPLLVFCYPGHWRST